MIILPMQ